uniref:Uncharacterized protein n=1 Tax=Vitis vinifera TaxID=29760 RepID=F6H9E7_VITVI
MAQNTTIPVKVGVVLDLDTWVGKMGLSCISMALSDLYASHGHYKTRVVTKIRDSKRDVVGAAAAGRLFFVNHTMVQRRKSLHELNFPLGLKVTRMTYGTKK